MHNPSLGPFTQDIWQQIPLPSDPHERAQVEALLSDFHAQGHVIAALFLHVQATFKGEHLAIGEPLTALLRRHKILEFKPMLLRDFFLLAVWIARVVYPSVPVGEAMCRVLRRAFASGAEMPAVQVIKRATQGKWSEFVSSFKLLLAPLQTGVQFDMHQPHPRCLELVFDQRYSELVSWSAAGAMLGFLDFFRTSGNAEILREPEGFVYCVVSWED